MYFSSLETASWTVAPQVLSRSAIVRCAETAAAASFVHSAHTGANRLRTRRLGASGAPAGQARPCALGGDHAAAAARPVPKLRLGHRQWCQLGELLRVPGLDGGAGRRRVPAPLRTGRDARSEAQRGARHRRRVRTGPRAMSRSARARTCRGRCGGPATACGAWAAPPVRVRGCVCVARRVSATARGAPACPFFHRHAAAFLVHAASLHGAGSSGIGAAPPPSLSAAVLRASPGLVRVCRFVSACASSPLCARVARTHLERARQIAHGSRARAASLVATLDPHRTLPVGITTRKRGGRGRERERERERESIRAEQE